MSEARTPDHTSEKGQKELPPAPQQGTPRSGPAAEQMTLDVDNPHASIGQQYVAAVINIYEVPHSETRSPATTVSPDDGGSPDDATKAKETVKRSHETYEYSFEDPTLPFRPPVSAPKYRFDEGEIGKWCHLLEKHRLIAVQSADDQITSAAVRTLLGLESLSSYQHRLLTFGARKQKRTDLYLENLLGEHLGDPDRPTILVADTEQGGMPFIDSTLGSENWAASMVEALRAQELLIIVQIASRYRRQLEHRLGAFHFLCWKVDFLRPLLYRHHPEGRVEDLFARISRQRKQGRWGPPDDDLYHFEVLEPLISGGTGRLEEALEEGLTLQASPSAVEVFKTGEPIYQGILVCAAFFRGLDVTEFAQIVFKLVGDECVLVSERKLTPGGSAPLGSRQRKPLREAWPRVADEIFKDCGLAVRTAGGQGSVAFAGPGERAALQTYVRSSVYFSTVSERLWQAGDLFDHTASPELVDGATSVFVEALAHHKEWKRPQWLTETLLTRLSNGDSKDLSDLLRKIAGDSLILSRISQVLRALVAHDDHAELVGSWLNHLLAQKGHFPALQLAMHLRYTAGFDYLFWLKRVSDESPPGVGDAAYSALYHHARQSSVRIWDFLDELKGWLPEPEKPGGALSNSHNFALQLIMQYAVDSAEALAVKEWGNWPSRYPLFKGLSQSLGSVDERLSALAGWLFHPAIRSVFRQNAETLVWSVRSRLVELWSCLLLGLDSEKTHPEAQAIYKQILELFWERSDREGWHRLLEGWRSNRRHLQAGRRKGDLKRSEYLALRIDLSVRLERDFKQLSEQRSSVTTRSTR